MSSSQTSDLSEAMAGVRGDSGRLSYRDQTDLLKRLDDAGFVITTKKIMQIYHEDQSEKEDMSCDNTM